MDFPYNLIVTTVAGINSNKGFLRSRAIRLDDGGLMDTSLLRTTTVNFGFGNITQTLASPAFENIDGVKDGRYADPNEDIVAYVGIDGRPAVNCLDGNKRLLHYVCDLSHPLLAQWQWDSTYAAWWDSSSYRWTPTTNYYISWNPGDAHTTSVTVPGLTSQTPNDDTTGFYSNYHEIVRPILRYAVGQGNTSNTMRGSRQKLFDIHTKPIKFISSKAPGTQSRALLIGIIERPPPIPWQNLAIPGSAQESSWGATTVTLAHSQASTIDTQTSTEMIAKTAGTVGIAWDISVSVGTEQFGSTSTQSFKSTDLTCVFKINPPPKGSSQSIPRDINAMGTAFLLRQDCELYDCTITQPGSSDPVPGSAAYQQAVFKSPWLEPRQYTMSRKHGVVQDFVNQPLTGQGLVAGRLSSYYRPNDSLLDSFLPYSLGVANTAMDALSFSWTNSGIVHVTGGVSSSNMTGSGTNFSVQALAGIGDDDTSALVGFQSSGSLTYSSTNTESASLDSYVSADLPYNSSAPGAYSEYSYKTYWLRENNAWTQNFQNVLADSSVQSDIDLANMIVPTSTPWVVTYMLEGTPSWNTGGWTLLGAIQSDWPTKLRY